MRELSLQDAKTLYRTAIDARARDTEGAHWWEAVRSEISAVIAAPSVHAAAAVIAWWHADWSQVADSPRGAAGRLRKAARSVRLPPSAAHAPDPTIGPGTRKVADGYR